MIIRSFMLLSQNIFDEIKNVRDIFKIVNMMKIVFFDFFPWWFGQEIFIFLQKRHKIITVF